MVEQFGRVQSGQHLDQLLLGLAAPCCCILNDFSLRVRLFEELRWDLAKVVDKAESGIPLQRILYGLDVNTGFIEKMVENIVGITSGITFNINL